jgi:DNA gyrase/topoisomerase IV subunit B
VTATSILSALPTGRKQQELEVTGTVGQRNTGTFIRFWPNPAYFDTVRFSTRRLRHTLRAKAVLCARDSRLPLPMKPAAKKTNGTMRMA